MIVDVQLCCTHAPDVPKLPGVYQVRSRVRGEIYVGSTKNLNRRFRDHLWSLMKGNHPNCKIQSLFNKRQILFFRVVVFCPSQNLKRYEQEILDRYRNNGKLLNRLRTAQHHRSWS